MRQLVWNLLFAALLCALTSRGYAAEVSTPCPRPQSGAIVTPPPDLYSRFGLLRLDLDYRTRTDAQGRVLFCFQTPDGLESPTLRVQPGDVLDITLTNRIPQSAPIDMPHAAAHPAMAMPMSGACGDTEMTGSSVNIHFHGMNIAPTCHSDEVLHTVVNPGHSFHYLFHIPRDEPAGLYWYHPHIHGISAHAVFGGASGAIIVGGIQAVQPAVVGLPERVLVIRDQPVAGVTLHGEPNADISLNYVPVLFPDFQPGSIRIKSGQREFWRVLNASADTIMDLELLYDGRSQPLDVVALDGVPTFSQDGSRRGRSITMRHILIPPAGRAEFIMAAPPPGTATPVLATRAIDTGPSGDADPARPLARLAITGAASPPMRMAPMPMPMLVEAQRFERLDSAPVSAHRRLYFSEVGSGPGGGGDGATNFFITVDGAQPVLYNPANPPAVTTRQGAVEDWTIENRSTENHEFHIHQIHFELLARNGKPVDSAERQMLDTVQVPYWSGTGPYPTVTLRMDFRGPVVGDFVYHCHLLDHEDGGMMAVIRVLPAISRQD